VIKGKIIKKMISREKTFTLNKQEVRDTEGLSYRESTLNIKNNQLAVVKEGLIAVDKKCKLRL